MILEGCGLLTWEKDKPPPSLRYKNLPSHGHTSALICCGALAYGVITLTLVFPLWGQTMPHPSEWECTRIFTQRHRSDPLCCSTCILGTQLRSDGQSIEGDKGMAYERVRSYSGKGSSKNSMTPESKWRLHMWHSFCYQVALANFTLCISVCVCVWVCFIMLKVYTIMSLIH